jgi:hypothetical protein
MKFYYLLTLIGLTFDIIGVIIIFIDDPSYKKITNDFIDGLNKMDTSKNLKLLKNTYTKIGLVFIVTGFMLQVIATIFQAYASKCPQ